ncbi:MAG: S49 family peptidase [Alphaproteobacteria bacterium]
MTAPALPLPHLAERVFNRAHLIDPRKARAILAALAPRLGLPLAVGPAAPSPAMQAPAPAAVPGQRSIAVIPVHGTLVARGSWMDAESGLQSYRGVLEDFRAARDDASVAGILFDVDSPGGECDGAFDLADEIAAARDVKPVWAVANHAAYSAAYAIAAACSRIVVSRTGGVGSIGVFGLHLDVSGADEQAGHVWTPVFAGARKLDGWEHRPLSDGARAAAQAEVDQLYGLFCGSVARWRGLDEKAVRATEAGCFSGLSGDAVRLGLADAVGTIDDALAELSAEITTRERSMHMAARRHPVAGAANPGTKAARGKGKPAASRPAAEDQEDTVVGAEGGEDEESMEGGDDTVVSAEGDDTVEGDDDEDAAPQAAGPAAAARAAERARCLAIVDMAQLAGADNAAIARAIRTGQSASAFRAAQAAAKRAGATGQPPIRPHHAARGGAGDDGWGAAFARHVQAGAAQRR